MNVDLGIVTLPVVQVHKYQLQNVQFSALSVHLSSPAATKCRNDCDFAEPGVFTLLFKII
jgi:hypothetical protein